MPKPTDNPLFQNIVRPQFALRSPNKILSEGDFELLRITVEDFRFVTREVTDDLTEVAAEIRARSTILRRLLCHSDLYNVGSIYAPKTPLRVKARMLDFDPAHPGIIISCGNYPCANDRLNGIAVELNIKGVERLRDNAMWKYREKADVPLSEYLDGLALSVLGTRIRRRELIKYVADKKAAHVSEKRKHTVEEAIDRVWSQLFFTIAHSGGQRVQLNVVYLELLPLIEALSESVSINSYINELAEWLSTAEITFPAGTRPTGITLPVTPTNRRGE